MKDTSGGLNWFTSSYSNGEGSCVEFAASPAGANVRDTKDREVGTHVFGRVQWSTFVDAVKSGEFDA